MATFTLPIATSNGQESNAVVRSKFQAGNEQVRLDHPEPDATYNIVAPNSTEAEMLAYRENEKKLADIFAKINLQAWEDLLATTLTCGRSG